MTTFRRPETQEMEKFTLFLVKKNCGLPALDTHDTALAGGGGGGYTGSYLHSEMREVKLTTK